jgi:hypothetical protein
MATWTAEKLADLFSAEHDAADEATREATASHLSPYGEAFESLVWHGTIAEAKADQEWPKVDPEDYEDGEQDADFPTDDDAAIEQASNVVGTGRPIYVVFHDGQFPAVFCEEADEDSVAEAVRSFYAADQIGG